MDLIRPHAVPEGLMSAYAEMAADEAAEAEALGWIEGVVGDVADEPR